jgi:three-Cys-motif partner protein
MAQTSKPYDLQKHVQRVLKHAPKPVAPKRPMQLSLLEPLVEVVEEPRLYETQAGLVADAEEMAFARAVSLHSAEKAHHARRYASIVGTAMREKKYRVWIELFAGPGKLYVRDTNTFAPGSPIEAMEIPHQFNRYIFSDLDPACTESLRKRVGKRHGVHILQGDANSPELLVEIAKLVSKDALVVLYGDPEGLHLHWDTIKFFIDRFPHLDLLLNVPISGVVRAVSAGYNEKASAVMNHPSPRDLLEPDAQDKGARYREWYWRNCAAAGFDQIASVPICLTGTNRELYDLMLASRNPLAKKFFRIAAGLPEDAPVAVSTEPQLGA